MGRKIDPNSKRQLILSEKKKAERAAQKLIKQMQAQQVEQVQVQVIPQYITPSPQQVIPDENAKVIFDDTADYDSDSDSDTLFEMEKFIQEINTPLREKKKSDEPIGQEEAVNDEKFKNDFDFSGTDWKEKEQFKTEKEGDKVKFTLEEDYSSDLIILILNMGLGSGYPKMYTQAAFDKEELREIRKLLKLRAKFGNNFSPNEDEQELLDEWDDYIDFCEKAPLNEREQKNLKAPSELMLKKYNVKVGPFVGLISVLIMIGLPRMIALNRAEERKQERRHEREQKKEQEKKEQEEQREKEETLKH